MKEEEEQEGIMPSKGLESIFDTFSDGVIVCNRQDKIVQINAAALKLFEMPSASLCRGQSYHQFLHRYEMVDELHQTILLEPWLGSLIVEGGGASTGPEKITLLQLPSEQKSYVTISSLPRHDAQGHVAGTVHVFHNITHHYQKALHLQRVHQAQLTLTQTIGRIAEQMELVFLEDTFLLSPPVLTVEQQLVDLVAQVLDCRHVTIWALGPPAGHVYYAAGSGSTTQEEHDRREISGRFSQHEVLDKRFLDRLKANEALLFSADDQDYPAVLSINVRVKRWLNVPLFLEEQWAGGLLIGKADSDGDFTLEEIDLVKAVASEAMLLLDCFRCLCKQARAEGRALAQHEMHRLTNDFLNLASHELNTPLTAIKGNVQVAQRRLMTLKRQLTAQSERVGEHIERVQDPLEAAVQGVRLQERMIEHLLDDARVQTNELELHMQRSDLSALVREAVASKQGSGSQRPIVLEITPSENRIPIVADAERITQVINTYLEHALSFSPADQSVIVQLTVEETVARVSVHDAGPAIPLEEQGRIWERLHAAKRIAGEQEPDAGFGLDFYLSRVLIELHHGRVGVQSDSDYGVSFWFTLPIEASAV